METATETTVRPHSVTIVIDKKKYESPIHTTGHALYVLGHVPAGYDLFLEIPGPNNDRLIPNDEHRVEVTQHMVFYSAKQNLNPGHE